MRKREKSYSVGLLPRMEARMWSDGKTVTYRYKPINGKSVNLGTDRQKAILAVAQLGANSANYGTLENSWLLYQDSIYWKRLGERSQENYTSYSKNLIHIFGKMHVSAIKPSHIARYLRVERIRAPVQANKEITLLSNIINVAIEHGIIDRNPCKEVKKNREIPRDITPDVDLLEKFLAWLSAQTEQRKIIAMAAEYASIAGSRQIEFLGLTWAQVDFKEGIIRTRRAKQRDNKKVIDLVVITAKMSALLTKLKGLNRDCLFVFPNSKNTKYTPDGFRTMWQKSIKKAINDGVILESERFAFHDLRAYYTTQHKNKTGALPDIHANPATTAKIYERSKQSRRSAL